MFNNLINKARNHNMRYKTKRFQCYFLALFLVQTLVWLTVYHSQSASISYRQPLWFMLKPRILKARYKEFVFCVY